MERCPRSIEDMEIYRFFFQLPTPLGWLGIRFREQAKIKNNGRYDDR